MNESARRNLKFDNWDEVKADLHSLRNGYKQHGNWNLEQASKHLNAWLDFPMDGFPAPPWPLRVMMVGIRVTVGKSMLRKTLASGKMIDGGPTVPQTVYSATNIDGEAKAVEALVNTIARFREFEGDIEPSPIFGSMDKQTAERLQWVHFAHHLSWLEPKSD